VLGNDVGNRVPVARQPDGGRKDAAERHRPAAAQQFGPSRNGAGNRDRVRSVRRHLAKPARDEAVGIGPRSRAAG
jgi:hypothetical protein